MEAWGVDDFNLKNFQLDTAAIQAAIEQEQIDRRRGALERQESRKHPREAVSAGVFDEGPDDYQVWTATPVITLWHDARAISDGVSESCGRSGFSEAAELPKYFHPVMHAAWSILSRSVRIHQGHCCSSAGLKVVQSPA